MKIQIKQSVDKALKALTDQQRNVIILRYGLDGKKKRTLQEIADESSLTRERIRQIQNIAIERLKEDVCLKELASALMHLEESLHKCGGVASEDALCAVCDLATEPEKNYVHILLQVGKKFNISPETDEVDQYWYADEKRKNAVDTVLQEIHKEFEKEKQANMISEKDLENLFATVGEPHQEHLPDYKTATNLSRKISKNPQGEWGLKSHPEVSLSNLAGYIRIVLRNAKKPLHFEDIAKKVSRIKGSPCHKGSCHNELVRRKEFILVGRGLYALEEMGYRPGTIADVIVACMKDLGPMTRDEVIQKVSEQRHVKRQSIVLALTKKDMFTKGEDGRYFHSG